jgi:phosphoglycolate phosphatase
MITTLLFDLDGTLVDSYGPITASLNAARAAFGLPPKTEKAVRREVGRGLEVLIEENLGAGRVEDGVAVFRQTYRTVFREGTRLLPGVAPTLAELARRAYRMAVTSNKPAYFTREIVAGCGLGSLFRAVYGPEMVTHPKPDPEMLHRAIEDLGSRREESAYVGDMVLDIESAHRAGLPVFLVASGGSTVEELQRAGADRIFHRFEDLLEALPPLEQP